MSRLSKITHFLINRTPKNGHINGIWLNQTVQYMFAMGRAEGSHGSVPGILCSF